MMKTSVIFNILTRSLSCLELESASLCRNLSPLLGTQQNYHILATNEKTNALITLIKWDQWYCFPGKQQDASVSASQAKSNQDLGALPHWLRYWGNSAWGCFCQGWKTAQDAHTAVLVQCV